MVAGQIIIHNNNPIIIIIIIIIINRSIDVTAISYIYRRLQVAISGLRWRGHVSRCFKRVLLTNNNKLALKFSFGLRVCGLT